MTAKMMSRWLVIGCASCVAYIGGGVAHAAGARPFWEVDVLPQPSVFSVTNQEECLQEIGSTRFPLCDSYVVSVRNSGAKPSDGGPIAVEGILPEGIVARKIQFFWSAAGGLDAPGVSGSTDLASTAFPGNPVTCSVAAVRCTISASIASDDTLRMAVYATATPSITGRVTAQFHVTGGGVVESAATAEVETGTHNPSFGIQSFTTNLAAADGAPETQAASHPYEMTERIDFANSARESPSLETGQRVVTSIEDVKDVILDLPLGLLGSATATPRCTFAELSALSHCPHDTVIGHLLTEPESAASVNSDLYNMVPERGVAAEFGFVDVLNGAHVLYGRVVPSPEGYRLRTVSRWIPQVPLTSVLATVYGNPAEKNGGGSSAVAFFTNPSWCSTRPLVSHLYVDTWQSPGAVDPDGEPRLSDPRWVTAEAATPAVTGCNSLAFSPTDFAVTPDTNKPDSSSGLVFELGVLQGEQPSTLASPPLRNATVTLPQGLSVNPASAAGLAGCTVGDVGWLGSTLEDFTPDEATCPLASKIGEVEVETPLLEKPLKGAIYLASPEANPFDALIAAYIVIDDPSTGVVVKIAGRISLDPSTGQISGTFDQNPQLPFSRLWLRFFGGAHGDLATPPACGQYMSTGEFEPWSAPESPAVPTVDSAFTIDGNCSASFAPSFNAGVVSEQAASYTPVVVTFGRTDQDEFLSAADVTLPRGLVAKLAGVGLCSELEVKGGNCPSDSQIGTVEAGAGAGPSPYFLKGRVYLTGPYNNGPFGLAVVVPVVAGPFNLGNVVVRESLRIDATTAQATVVSDPFPRIIRGIPVRLRAVRVTIDRPDFALNPTNCAPTSFTARFESFSSVSSGASARYQAAGCRELAFQPTMTARSNKKISRLDGASLEVSVKAHVGQANLAKVKVRLPRTLPARLPTLNRACRAEVFENNPAACPATSLVGMASATTPLLDGEFSGPAYIVSHGNAAFPDVQIVLQGHGITLVLDGKTAIRAGITTSTFSTLPDVPVNTFRLDLPQGPHSILGAYTPKHPNNLCPTRLIMPVEITAQNGLVKRASVKIAVSGCRHHRGLRIKKHRG